MKKRKNIKLEKGYFRKNIVELACSKDETTQNHLSMTKLINCVCGFRI